MFRRAISTLAAVLLMGLSVVALTATAAEAKTGCPKEQNSNGNQYPPGQCKAKTNDSSLVAGESTKVCGDGYTPGQEVVLQLDDQGNLGTATVGTDGTVCITGTVPKGTSPGTHVLGLFQRIGDRYTTVKVRVLGNRAGLPFTGSEIAGLTGLGAGTLILGGFLVMAGRRRRVPATATA